jgi:hypothetical protein
MSWRTSGSIQVVQNVARFWRELPSRISSSRTRGDRRRHAAVPQAVFRKLPGRRIGGIDVGEEGAANSRAENVKWHVAFFAEASSGLFGWPIALWSYVETGAVVLTIWLIRLARFYER